MRIAYVTPEFVSEEYFSGGLANYVHRISRAMAEWGHDVHVVTRSGCYDVSPHGPVTLHRLTIPRPRSRWMPARVMRRLLRPVTGRRPPKIELLRDQPRQRRLSESEQFAVAVQEHLLRLHQLQPWDVVQYASFHACGLQSLLDSPPWTCVTRISSYRPAWNRCCGVKSNRDVALLEALEREQIIRSRHVFAPSRLLRDVLDDQLGVRAEVIQTPFFIETSQANTEYREKHLSGKNYFLFVGRLQRHKGIDVLTDALPAFLTSCSTAHVVFAGIDPGGRIQRKWETAQPALRGRCLFTGQLPHESLYPLMERARAVVLPSRIDNLPNTMLESMAHGTPVIGTRGASFDEVITDGKDGFLVPIGDAPALARKMVEVWNHPAIEQIGRSARQTLERFSPDRLVPQLEMYYRRTRMVDASVRACSSSETSAPAA